MDHRQREGGIRERCGAPKWLLLNCGSQFLLVARDSAPHVVLGLAPLVACELGTG